MNPWYVYIVECNDATLYTGITTNLARRVGDHNNGTGSARYTRARRPVKLVYHETAACRSSATRRELEIKRLSRNEKICMIRSAAEQPN